MVCRAQPVGVLTCGTDFSADLSTGGADPIAEHPNIAVSRAVRARADKNGRVALPAHVTRAIGPSPARAQPHDAAAWLPVPDPLGLPSIETLLAQMPAVDAVDLPTMMDLPNAIDLAALEAFVSPSPARAEPHDAAAWLPLPDDLHMLPPLEELRDPRPEVQAAVIAEAEAVVRDALAAAQAVVVVSPARAEPHDAAAWLPLPNVEALPELHRFVEGPSTSNGDDQPREKRRHRIARMLPPGRVLFIAFLASVTVVGATWMGSKILAPGGSAVSLMVDGRRISVRTDAGTVRTFLVRQHVRLAQGDTVDPSLDVHLHDGLPVHVVRAFAVTVDIDGKQEVVRTTEHSADALARDLKLGHLVAVRNRPGRLDLGSSVVFRTRRGGQLALDGQNITYDSPSLTVDELLQSYNVALTGNDYVVPARDAVLTDGLSVKVMRVGDQTQQATDPIPFTDERTGDPNLPIGQTRLVHKGKKGTAIVTYRVRVENGTVVDRQIVSKIPSIAPISHLVAYGTKADWHWDALAQCESGSRWDTVDPSPTAQYDGGLGIYRETWKHWGGLEFAPNAGLATREEQIIVGMRIYADLGWDPWGCANNVLHWPNRT